MQCWSVSDLGKGCAIMCNQHMWRSRSFQISQHLRQHFTSFTRHCAKTDHAESTHYGSMLQPYRISISAQCVDSLCSYLYFRQQLQTIPPGLSAVWDNTCGVATPRLHACTIDWTIKACLQSLHVSLGCSYVASATSTNCNWKLWLVHIQAVDKISLLNYSIQMQSTAGHVA